MRKIGNKFNKVGTNPMRYIENFLLYFNLFPIGIKFEIDDENFSILQDGVPVFNSNSITTLRQNIDCWLGLGLMIRDSNNLIKIVDNQNTEQLIDYSKGILICDSNDNKLNSYRDTILIKIVYMIDHNKIDPDVIFMKNHEISITDIEHEIGRYEKILFQDNKFIEIVKTMWGVSDE